MAKLELNLVNGGQWDIWVKNAEFLEHFIRENRLRALRPAFFKDAHAGAAKVQLRDVNTNAEAFVVPRDIFGGMRVAHLHLGGEIYLLDDEQWAQFSSKLVDDSVKKLASVKAISFEQLTEVVDAIDRLPTAIAGR